MTEDEKWMLQALALAREAFAQGEIPIGAVIVKDGKLIGKGFNQIELLKDATAHAEILAIGVASAAVENWRLEGATLYATLEPCPMCAGAILNSRISRVVFGSRDSRFGACGTRLDILKDNPIGRIVEVSEGIFAEECLDLIKRFFQETRARKGDSGKKI